MSDKRRTVSSFLSSSPTVTKSEEGINKKGRREVESFKFSDIKLLYEPVQPAEGFIGKSTIEPDTVERVTEDTVKATLGDILDKPTVTEKFGFRPPGSGKPAGAWPLLMTIPSTEREFEPVQKSIQEQRSETIAMFQADIQKLSEDSGFQDLRNVASQINGKRELFNNTEKHLDSLLEKAKGLDEVSEEFSKDFESTLKTFKELAGEHNILLAEYSELREFAGDDVEMYRNLNRKLAYAYQGTPVLSQGKRSSFFKGVWERGLAMTGARAARSARAAYDLVIAEELGINPSAVSPDLYDVFLAGFGESIPGIRARGIEGKTFPQVHPEAMRSLRKFLYGAGQLGGDLPVYGLGYAVGAAGGPIVGMISSFAVADGVRAMYQHILDNGMPDEMMEFNDIVSEIVIEMGKGAAVGLAAGTAGAGAAGTVESRLGKEVASFAVEVPTFISVAAALDNRFPTQDEILSGLILIGALKYGMHPINTAQKVRGVLNLNKLITDTAILPRGVEKMIKEGTLPIDAVDIILDGKEVPPELAKLAKEEVKKMEDIQAKLIVEQEAKADAKEADKALAKEQKEKAREVERIKKKTHYAGKVGEKVEERPEPKVETKEELLEDLDKGENLIDQGIETIRREKKRAEEAEAKKHLKGRDDMELLNTLVEEGKLVSDEKTIISYNDGKFVIVRSPIEGKEKGNEWSLFKDGEHIDTFVSKKAAKANMEMEIEIDAGEPRPKQEPITELDEATGVKPPVELEPDIHPFRNTNKEETNARKIILEKDTKKLMVPETFTTWAVNEINRWLNGEKVKIEEVRDDLSMLAADAEEFRGEFAKQEDFEIWKSSVIEAAEWARETDRIKPKRTDKPTSADRLNMMIPVDEIPKHVRALLKFWEDKLGYFAKDKDTDRPYGKIYRNEEIFNATGFWVDRGGQWRWELSDEKFRFKSVFMDEASRKTYTKFSLEQAIDHPALFKAIPEMKKTKIQIVIESELPGWGAYIESKDLIKITSLNLDNLAHELQHVADVKLKSMFTGTSVRAMEAVQRNELVDRLWKTVTDIETLKDLKAIFLGGFGKEENVRSLSKYIKNISKSPEKSSEAVKITEALLEYQREEAFESYLKDPGEMNARLNARRRKMSKWERKEKPPWETLEEMLYEEGLTEGRFADSELGMKLYSGIDPFEIYKLGRFASDLFSFKGRKFSLGVVDMRDGVIDQTVPHQKAIDADWHHSIWVRPELQDAVYSGDKRVFWFQGTTPVTHSGKLPRNIEAKIKEAVVQGKGDTGVILYSGIDPGKVSKDLIEMGRKASELMDKEAAMTTLKPGEAVDRTRKSFNRAFVDRSGNIRKEMLNVLDDVGYGIIQGLYLAKGAPARATNLLIQMNKEVSKGLSRKEKKIRDKLILMDRMIAIGKYKTTKKFAFPEGKDPVSATLYRSLFQYYEGITSEQAAKISQRAEAYFDWMKVPLKDMLEAELISQKEYDDLSSHNYRKIRLIDIFDKKEKEVTIGTKQKTVYDSGIEVLARGRETDVYEKSSDLMALEVFARAYGRIMNNKANRNLLSLAKSDKTNPFVRIKEKGGERIPSGWQRIFAYENAERKTLFISPEMAKEWINASPEMTYRLSNFVRYASGAPVLRMFATGINWGFAMANLPRDVMHTWFTARVFEDGKWKYVYSPHAPIFGMQMARDQTAVFGDALLRRGRMTDYIDEGGGMEFFVTQGRLLQRGKYIRGPLDPIMDFLGYFGETTEIMTRLAIRERVIRRRAKEQGISMEEARKDSDITQEATFAARDYMDFGQGGGVAKALDNGIPYLNASIQGTRGMLRAAKDNPAIFTYKMTQFAGAVVGMYIASHKLNSKTMEALRDNASLQNNLIIPLGDAFGFLDEKGQMRYPFLKLPLDPSQRFFKAFFEAATDKWLGNEVDAPGIVELLKSLSPVDIGSLPPTLSGFLGYVTNTDFWQNEEIWRQTPDALERPRSKEEYIPGKTPQAYIDFGDFTGFSPERTKALVEQITTRGTVWSYLAGKGYDTLLGDLPKSQKQQHLAEAISKTPVIKRFFGITSPYSRFAEPIDEAKQKDQLERFLQNRGLDTLVNGHLFEKNVDRKEINEYIRGFKDRDIRKRLKERWKFSWVIRDIPNRSFWLALRGIPSAKARAEVYVRELEKTSEEGREDLRRGMKTVRRAGGIISSDFRREVIRLRREPRE